MPAYLFTPVWTILYILLGVSVGLIWHQGIEKKPIRTAISIYVLQLILHSLWVVFFFGLKLPGVALIDNALLFGVVFLCGIHFYRIKKLAGYLMIPYFLWEGYAVVLNFVVWQMN